MDIISTDPNVTHAIQQAVAPVFLLTGVGSLLGVLANRLARIVDRFRTLQAKPEPERSQVQGEILLLQRRSRLIHHAIRFFTVCALMICVVVSALFIGVELDINVSSLVALLFITGMASLTAGLICFLREVSLATARIEHIAPGTPRRGDEG